MIEPPQHCRLSLTIDVRRLAPARPWAASVAAGVFTSLGLCLPVAGVQADEEVLAAGNGAALQEFLDKNADQRSACSACLDAYDDRSRCAEMR